MVLREHCQAFITLSLHCDSPLPYSLQNFSQNISVYPQVQGLILRHDLPAGSAKFRFSHFEGDLIVQHHHGGLHLLSHLNNNILKHQTHIAIRQTNSLFFSLPALKLLAFFRDLLKLRILFRMGSGRTLDSSGESEGTGVRVLSCLGEGSTGGGGLGYNIATLLTTEHHQNQNLPN